MIEIWHLKKWCKQVFIYVDWPCHFFVPPKAAQSSSISNPSVLPSGAYDGHVLRSAVGTEPRDASRYPALPATFRIPPYDRQERPEQVSIVLLLHSFIIIFFILACFTINKDFLIHASVLLALVEQQLIYQANNSYDFLIRMIESACTAGPHNFFFWEDHISLVS